MFASPVIEYIDASFDLTGITVIGDVAYHFDSSKDELKLYTSYNGDYKVTKLKQIPQTDHDLGFITKSKRGSLNIRVGKHISGERSFFDPLRLIFYRYRTGSNPNLTIETPFKEMQQ